MASPAEDFLRAVLRSGLLTKPELQAALADFPPDPAPQAKAIAAHLVAAGKLTSFQSTKLLAGAAVGLKLGPYHILAPIGKGGMGVVYLGLDTRSAQHVAIKVLSPQRQKEGDRHRARFFREIEISKTLLHPNLVIAQDIGSEEGVHYLVMEYIPGQTLHRLVTTQGPITVPHVSRLFLEVAAALEYAHRQGLIHRDLKPANIMVTPNDHAKVLDLGLAIVQGEDLDDVEVLGGKGHVVGSFDYIAPEQTRDAARVDGRADIYSMGCSIYFSLTGRPPFPGGTVKDKIKAHRHTEPELITQLNVLTPRDFADLVHRMMAKNVEQRPASMAEVRALLSPWAVAEPDRPMDQEHDPTFQAAVTALQNAPAEEGSFSIIRPSPPSQAEEPAADDNRFKLLVVGASLIWGMVLLLLLLVLLLR